MIPCTNSTSQTPVSKRGELTLAVWITDEEMAADIQSCLGNLPVRQADVASGGDWDTWVEQVERARPDVVILGVTQVPGTLTAAIQRLRWDAGAPAVVAVDTATDPEVVLGAIRAGAAEYVYPPVAAHLGAALDRVAETLAHHSGSVRCGKTVAFVSAKGGCGATTVACHVAAGLAQQTGKTALLADFDLDTGVVGFLTKTRSAYTVADALRSAERLDPSYWKALTSQAGPGLDVVCSPGSPAPDTDVERTAPVLDFARTQYDFVVVDLGRGLSRAAVNALDAVDEIYLVTTLDVPALYRCQQMIRTLLEHGLSRDRVHLAANRIGKNTQLTRDEIEQMLNLPVSCELPDDPAALADAYVEGKLLPAANDLARRIARLARQIAGIPEEVPKRRFTFSWLPKPSDCRPQQAALARRD